MTAQIIQFRDYQNPRRLRPMHGDIERRLADLNHMASEVFNALMIDMAAMETALLTRTCVIIEDRLCPVGSQRIFD